MWHKIVLAWLSKAALPIAGAALTVVLSLSAALWWTASSLSTARDRLASAHADLLSCTRANASAGETIAALQQAAERNRQQRDAALREQQAALARIAELEQDRREQTTETVERIIRIADGDACAHLPISDRLRDAARGD